MEPEGTIEWFDKNGIYLIKELVNIISMEMILGLMIKEDLIML